MDPLHLSTGASIWTLRSACQLLVGYRGLLVMCLKWYLVENSANSRELNCGPLLLITVSGMPCLENIDLSADTTLRVVMVRS